MDHFRIQDCGIDCRRGVRANTSRRAERSGCGTESNECTASEVNRHWTQSNNLGNILRLPPSRRQVRKMSTVSWRVGALVHALSTSNRIASLTILIPRGLQLARSQLRRDTGLERHNVARASNSLRVETSSPTQTRALSRKERRLAAHFRRSSFTQLNARLRATFLHRRQDASMGPTSW